ncbi:hypothetical protein JI665_22865, partial [Bacillus sp. NTK034]|nr:hypothetical protein [Bacillus sp. NTK034]
ERRRKAVRIRARFGQDEGKKGKSSPNTSQVRTGCKREGEKQSEYEPGSDRMKEKKGKAVRIRA